MYDILLVPGKIIISIMKENIENRTISKIPFFYLLFNEFVTGYLRF